MATTRAREGVPSSLLDRAELSVVIVNWNTRDLLAGCLASIEAHPPAACHEVWVIDNASSDGSVVMVRERFPWVRLVENATNDGFAAGNNQGIRLAGGRHVVLLNSDTEVGPGAIETLVEFMDQHPDTGACGPLLLNADGSLQPSCHPMLTPGREFWRLIFLDQLWPRATYRQERWDRSVPRRVEVIKGACLVLRRAALEQVGMLDERYFMYTEEVDLCWRLARAGWSLWWVPHAAVKHYGGGSSKQVRAAMYLQLYRSKVQFYRKTGGEREAARFKRLVRLAYRPRLTLAALGARFSSPRAAQDLAAQVSIYRQLLAELPEM